MKGESTTIRSVHALPSCLGGKHMTLIHHIVFFALGSCVTIAFLLLVNTTGSSSFARLRQNTNKKDGCLVSFGAFRGQEYRTKETVASHCLVESKFVKIQQHSVLLDDAASVIPDWIWIDYHERINVLVQASSATDSLNNQAIEPSFTVLQQTKYALDGRQSMALVGGIVEPGEEPRDAAQREVQEEMNLLCQSFVFLGRYRTDVNRGMGWTNGFLAQDCTKAPFHTHTDSVSAEQEQVGGADTERQDMKTISLQELKRLVQDGAFIEIQWTAIASLALLYLERQSS